MLTQLRLQAENLLSLQDRQSAQATAYLPRTGRMDQTHMKHPNVDYGQ